MFVSHVAGAVMYVLLGSFFIFHRIYRNYSTSPVMVSTRGVRYKFSEGERVLCYEPDPTKAKVLYDSKVSKIINFLCISSLF